MSDPFMGVVPMKNVHVKEGQNPRNDFDPEELDALGSSVEATAGLVQPLAVEPIEGKPGHFWIVDGERRWRILKAAEVKKVPVYESQSGNPKLAATAANVMSAKLNHIEEAEGIKAAAVLANAKTNREIAKVTGFKEGHVAAAMRLIRLPEVVQAHIAAGYIPVGAEPNLRKLAKYSPALADCACQLVRDGALGGRDLIERIGEVVDRVADSDLPDKPIMVDLGWGAHLGSIVSDHDKYAELIERCEKITNTEPGTDPIIRFGSQEVDAARAAKVLIEVPKDDHYRHTNRTTLYVMDEKWAVDLAVRVIQREEKRAKEADEEAERRAKEAEANGDTDDSAPVETERAKRKKARKAAEEAHTKNLAIGRGLIGLRGAKNRKENKAAWVEAIAAVVLRDNESLPAAGLGLAFEQLQTIQYKTIKVSGEEQKTVTYARPEECRKYLWDRIVSARTADEKLELLAEAITAVVLVDPEAVPRSRRVFYWLKSGEEVAKILGAHLKTVRTRARRRK